MARAHSRQDAIPGVQRQAFTLLELLITLAIIAILAALLLVALSSAKLRAQQIHCTGNVRQLGIIGLIYAGDNGNTRVIWTPHTLAAERGWAR
jgi:prepilin-type N-terminal cleavage/methylation domain-containing protein